MTDPPKFSTVRLVQLIAVSVVGAVAVLSYLTAKIFDVDGLMTVAQFAGMAAAVVGVSFAFVGNDR